MIKVEINEIAALNTNSHIHKISPVQTIEGDWVVGEDLLSEPVFAFAHEYLSGCPVLKNVQFPIPTLE
jgi:hypothetical protein